MNADEVAHLCEALSLKEKEGPLMPLLTVLRNDGENRLALRLVGKMLSSKLVNREAFIHLIPKFWKIKQGVEIEVVDRNVFSFTFRCADDRRQEVGQKEGDNGMTGTTKLPQDSVFPGKEPTMESENESWSLGSQVVKDVGDRDSIVENRRFVGVVSSGLSSGTVALKGDADIVANKGGENHNKEDEGFLARLVGQTEEINDMMVDNGPEIIQLSRNLDCELAEEFVKQSMEENSYVPKKGDFNEILEESEKLGGPLSSYVLMSNFRSVLDGYGLQDMGFVGSACTWCNKRKARRSQNRIHGIFEVVKSYFSELFKTSSPSRGDLNWVLSYVKPCVSDGQQFFLDYNFSTEEILKAVFDMHLTKVLGPDGLPALFNQKYWSIVGKKVTKARLGVLNEGHGLEQFNDT
ncbi:hypothetical protein Dsin_018659 [Dipteronia sinensis]|uniref:Uncharacterized protein n=1 Tax=Dipteronia sinensis TaxID=43782 RepID=A0AAE0E244_9ROSI|nr:hypothetical protein Dsin_018659 [Dipteronia sinensis]